MLKTDWPFELVDGKLVAKDGEAIEKMLQRGLNSDIDMAGQDNFYEQFLVRRTKHELEELRDQEAMASGERNFNTIITFSPYSEEYVSSEESKRKLVAANQKPYWQRGVLRVSHWDGQRLNISTRSIDNSSVGLFKETAEEALGYKFTANDSTEMLGERIHLKLDIGSGAILADKIANTSDQLIAEARGGRWEQGRPVEEAKDLQAYVEGQQQIIEELLKIDRDLAASSVDFETYQQTFDREIRKAVALLEMRLELGREDEKIIDYAMASTAAGNMADAAGKVYDMCGHMLSPNSTEAKTANQTGFESLLRLSGKKVECPACEKKVVVANDKLNKGRLHCSHCGFEVDGCTGQVYHKSNRSKKRATKNR